MNFRIGSKQLGTSPPYLREQPRQLSLRLGQVTHLDPSRVSVTHDPVKLSAPILPGQLHIEDRFGSSNPPDSPLLKDSKPPDNPSLEKAKAPGTIYGITLTQKVVEQAKEAAGAIADIRDQQLAYAEEAKSISNPVRQATLNTEVANLQTEISRIAGETAINGQNVFQNNALSMQQYPPEKLNEVLNVPNFSNIATDPGVSLANQTNATGAYTILQQAAQSAHDAKDAISSASDKVQAIIDKNTEIKVDPKPPDKITSVEEAEKLTASILDNINSRINKKDPLSLILFNDLDPARVQALLS